MPHLSTNIFIDHYFVYSLRRYIY